MSFIVLPYLHNWFLTHIVEGTFFVKKIQSIRNGPLDKFMLMISSLLGGFKCYLFLSQILYWCINAAIARKILTLWAFGFYLANFLKDLLLLPHASKISESITGVEKFPTSKYGLPSVQAYSSFCFPVFLFFLTYGGEQIEYSFSTGFFIVFSWCFLVSFSRIYLGIHCPADVLAGIGLGIAVVLLWKNNTGDMVNTFFFNSLSSISRCYFFTSVTFLLLIFYPVPLEPSQTFIDTACVNGFATGFLVGSSCMSKKKWLLLKYENVQYTSQYATKALIRAGIGYFVVVITFLLVYRLIDKVIPRLNCVEPHISRNNASILAAETSLYIPSHLRNYVTLHLKKEKKQSKQKLKTVLPSCNSMDYPRNIPLSFFTFWATGFSATFVVPAVVNVVENVVYY